MTSSKTLVELLQQHADAGTATGYRYVVEGERIETEISFSQLAGDAMGLSHVLSSLATQGSRVLLVYRPGLEFVRAFYAVLCANIIAVPLAPPTGDFPAWRATLDRVVADSGAVLVLTTTEILTEALDHLDSTTSGTRWIATDSIECDPAGAPAYVPGASNVAFLQYTSGSTSSPKGVVLRHEHLLANQRAISQAFGLSGSSRMLSWLPMYHDMGLIGCVIQPLFVGCDCFLMSPFEFLWQPSRWLIAADRFRATITGGPNFSFELCLRRTSDMVKEELDLSSLVTVFNGAEPIRAETIRQFSEAFASCGLDPRALRPCYGLAEACLLVAAVPPERDVTVLGVGRARLEPGVLDSEARGWERTELVGVGRVTAGHEVVIASTHARQLEDGRVGEIWVRGPSVASGYWENDDETQRSFDAYLSDGSGPFLRTGDDGFLIDGELFVSGRSKEVIIVRGRNIYPQDIEMVAQSGDSQLRPGCGAAFGVTSEDGDVPVLVQETSNGGDAEATTASIRRRVAAAIGIQLGSVVLVPSRTLPKTSSGKLRRLDCKRLFLEGGLPVLHRWDDGSNRPGFMEGSILCEQDGDDGTTEGVSGPVPRPGGASG